ncbi:MAG: Na+/H+ antiporter NhaC family protein, partial [Thermoanaerobaculia bacterium]
MAATQEIRSRPLSVAAAALPLITLIACFLVGGIFFDLDADMLVLALLVAASVAGIQAVLRGATWMDIQRSTGEKLAAVLPVILILLTIGMLIGTWVLSGTIPALISAGIQILSPRFFVLSAFLVTAVMSLATGTSWGSAGTLGVALMGAAAAVQAPLAATAGAVISGAYLGDKMSPLSDSTNICAIGAGADLYAHIRNMLYTAVPSSLVALLVYSTLGRRSAAGSQVVPESAQTLLAEMDRVFSLGLWTLLPLLVVLAGIALKVSPALALAASSLVAMILGGVLQGFGIQSVLTSAVRGFDPAMVADLGLDPTSLSESFVQLLDRGGLYSMS